MAGGVLHASGDLKCQRLEAVDDFAQSRHPFVVTGERSPVLDGGDAQPRPEADEGMGVVEVAQQERWTVKALAVTPLRPTRTSGARTRPPRQCSRSTSCGCSVSPRPPLPTVSAAPRLPLQAADFLPERVARWTLAAPALGVIVLSRLFSQRTRTRRGSRLMTSSIVPVRGGWPTRSLSITRWSPSLTFLPPPIPFPRSRPAPGSLPG